MRILVTGGAGFIGSHVADALIARGDDVHIVDNLSSGKRQNIPAAAQLHEADVRTDAADVFVQSNRRHVLRVLTAQTAGTVHAS